MIRLRANIIVSFYSSMHLDIQLVTLSYQTHDHDHNIICTDLQVTSLPFVLFQSNGGIHNVVEGSVIQLYCSVESTTASFSWTKEGSPVVIDVPHLRERISNDSSTTTSVLTMDNFQSSDTGTYQCSARDGMKTGNGAYVTLNGIELSFKILSSSNYILNSKAVYLLQVCNCILLCSLPFKW